MSLSVPNTIIPFVEAMQQLRTRMQDDLGDKHFLFVVDDLAKFYGQKSTFGALVAGTFPDSSEEFERAGSCLALQEGAACVFHLMRGMEGAVVKLGKRVKVTITPKTTWRKITGEMDKKIQKMPDNTFPQQRRKDKWESARSSLHTVGSVWRNKTMHPAKTYTPAQALDVFNAVRVLMNDLCVLLPKRK